MFARSPAHASMASHGQGDNHPAGLGNGGRRHPCLLLRAIQRDSSRLARRNGKRKRIVSSNGILFVAAVFPQPSTQPCRGPALQDPLQTPLEIRESLRADVRSGYQGGLVRLPREHVDASNLRACGYGNLQHVQLDDG